MRIGDLIASKQHRFRLFVSFCAQFLSPAMAMAGWSIYLRVMRELGFFFYLRSGTFVSFSSLFVVNQQ